MREETWVQSFLATLLAREEEVHCFLMVYPAADPLVSKKEQPAARLV